MIRDGDVGSEKVSQGSYDAGGFQIARGIVVFTNDEDTGMMTSQVDDQRMKLLIVIMISRDDRPAIFSSVPQVDWVIVARQSDIRWQLNIMPGCSKQLGKKRGCEVIIQIEIHER